MWEVAETVAPGTCRRDEEAVGSAESGALLPVPGYGWRDVIASRGDRYERVVWNAKFGYGSRDGDAVGRVRLAKDEVQ